MRRLVALSLLTLLDGAPSGQASAWAQEGTPKTKTKPSRPPHAEPAGDDQDPADSEGKSDASLEETLEFIREKIQGTELSSIYTIGVAGLEGRRYAYSVLSEHFHTNGCRVNLIQTTTRQFARTAKKGGQVLPDDVNIQPFWIELGKLVLSDIAAQPFDPHDAQRKSNEDAAAAIDKQLTTLSAGNTFAVLMLPARRGFRSERLIVESEELAGRLAKAFAHAATLCGAKKDPF